MSASRGFTFFVDHIHFRNGKVRFRFVSGAISPNARIRLNFSFTGALKGRLTEFWRSVEARSRLKPPLGALWDGTNAWGRKHARIPPTQHTRTCNIRTNTHHTRALFSCTHTSLTHTHLPLRCRYVNLTADMINELRRMRGADEPPGGATAADDTSGVVGETSGVVRDTSGATVSGEESAASTSEQIQVRGVEHAYLTHTHTHTHAHTHCWPACRSRCMTSITHTSHTRTHC